MDEFLKEVILHVDRGLRGRKYISTEDRKDIETFLNYAFRNEYEVRVTGFNYYKGELEIFILDMDGNQVPALIEDIGLLPKYIKLTRDDHY